MACKLPLSLWKRLDDLRAQRAAGVLGQFVRVLGHAGVIADLFQDAGQVADGDALGQEVLQDALHLADVQLARESIR